MLPVLQHVNGHAINMLINMIHKAIEEVLLPFLREEDLNYSKLDLEQHIIA